MLPHRTRLFKCFIQIHYEAILPIWVSLYLGEELPLGYATGNDPARLSALESQSSKSTNFSTHTMSQEI